MAVKRAGLYDGVEVVNIGDNDAGIQGYGDDGVGASYVTVFVDREDIPKLIEDLDFFYHKPEGFPKWLTT